MAVPAIDKQCPVCGGEVTDWRIVGHWSEVGGGGGYWIEGNCVPCEIGLQIAVSGKGSNDWRFCVAEREWLIEKLTEEDVARLTAKLSRYKISSAKWLKFLTQKREADELWRFAGNTPHGPTGITLVRNGTPIADYRVLGDITIDRGI